MDADTILSRASRGELEGMLYAAAHLYFRTRPVDEGMLMVYFSALYSRALQRPFEFSRNGKRSALC